MTFQSNSSASQRSDRRNTEEPYEAQALQVMEKDGRFQVGGGRNMLTL